MAMTKRPVASPAQCRAARALLRWTQGMLAQHATVARKTVADFELGNRSLHRRTRLDITVALEASGVEFIWGGEGEGVRFARKAAPAQAAAQPVTQPVPQMVQPAADNANAARRAVP
jgi:hypothetical protein